ncbi:alpha-glucosidase [Aromatoleum bremense]|uniref:Alpha,alpha-phosphotrehalase n=1 Tax=Aromatoleum bremense TaxID=76115 RepID=A0ABX1P071_9RHOO|nr:alpha-glucosidase [Aromatoleum bremense]NMG17302.1 alpha,alpha-phosphotrehalase [Aromatoleum bremense]QTQ33113.1 Oligo-1,6-glucosidase [Aromatoleum bremense]
MRTAGDNAAGRAWWKEAVVYQIYPRSFMDSNGDGIGDLNGITARLDYVKSLGVDVIWLCPVFSSPNDDNGYDISDYRAIMDEFGTMADFDRLLAEVHRRGMRLILDLVANHTSDAHPWFLESRASLNSPKRDWYLWRDGKDGREPNNWESIFKGSAWKHDDETGQYFLHLFSERQPDLNWDNPEVRTAIYEMVRWWLDKGVDGFRLDAVSHKKKEPGLPDMPNPHGLDYVPSFEKHMNVDGVLDYLDELCRHTFDHYDVMTVGEANGVSPEQARAWVGEEHRRLNMIFQFEHSALWKKAPRNGLDLPALKAVLTKWQKSLEGIGWNALFLENHDLPRVVSRWGDTGRYWRESATALATMYFLMQGTPFIYQGQELGMTNSRFAALDDFNDVLTKNRFASMKREGLAERDIIDLLSIVSRDNARAPMQWDGSANAGFSTGTPWLRVNPNFNEINAELQERDPASVLNHYRRLIGLRKREPGLVHGHYELLMEDDAQIYAYSRTHDAQRYVIITNMTRDEARYHQRGLLLDGGGLLLANQPVEPHAPTDSLLFRPYEARVYRLG